MRELIIGSRGSRLALWQAHWARDSLQSRLPETRVEIRVIRTQGDVEGSAALDQLPGKGFFVKEIEEALMAEEIDLAVHSMKDVPSELPEGLMIAAVTAREDPRDVLVTLDAMGLEELPQGAKVGTGSPRRAGQLLYRRSDLRIEPLRGNVDTRVRRLREGRYDAIVLAAAGLNRLELDVPRVPLDIEVCMPAVGQGALGIETRESDDRALAAAALLSHQPTAVAVTAERSFLNALGGGCRVPIGGLGVLDGAKLVLTGVVARPDGGTLLRDEIRGEPENCRALGEELARSMLHAGAAEILGQRTG